MIGHRARFRDGERLHPEVCVWETCTPYFETRNIHFYVNRLGFHIVEFFNERHPGSSEPPEDFIGSGNEGMFKFRKEIHKVHGWQSDWRPAKRGSGRRG